MSEKGPDHILVVDDDARLRELLRRYLIQHGFMVSLASDTGEALYHLERITFDLIVLDVMLPDVDGLELTSRLRKTNTVPILLLTARTESGDRIRGLEVGADDYLTKPFEPRELILRIKTILRRVQPVLEYEAVRFGPFSFDPANLELKRDGEAVYLTTGEASLLKILAEQPGKSIGRAELGARGRFAGSDRAVDVQIVRLRRKIEEDPRQPRWLLTMRGAGYALRTGT